MPRKLSTPLSRTPWTAPLSVCAIKVAEWEAVPPGKTSTAAKANDASLCIPLPDASGPCGVKNRVAPEGQPPAAENRRGNADVHDLAPVKVGNRGTTGRGIAPGRAAQLRAARRGPAGSAGRTVPARRVGVRHA